MNIVCVASEGVPFAKTGGLADVAGSLSRALSSLGHTACLFLPSCHRRARLAEPSLDKHRAAEYTRLYEEIIRRVQASPVQSVVGESAPWW